MRRKSNSSHGVVRQFKDSQHEVIYCILQRVREHLHDMSYGSVIAKDMVRYQLLEKSNIHCSYSRRALVFSAPSSCCYTQTRIYGSTGKMDQILRKSPSREDFYSECHS